MQPTTALAGSSATSSSQVAWSARFHAATPAGVRLEAASRRVVVGPREALRTRRISLRDVNWIGERTIEDALSARRLEIFVKVRSTRAPQPAWLEHGAGGFEVELVEGEDGVSPGQACALYDAAQGQARVLGGGFIVSATAANIAPARRAELAFKAAARG